VARARYIRSDGRAINPTTGEVIADLYVASDGRWVWHGDESHYGHKAAREPEAMGVSEADHAAA
jgi:hypothetical protein